MTISVASVASNMDEMNAVTAEASTYRFLVVEDDRTQWPLWESIILNAFPEAEIDWETTEAGAEALLRHSFHTDKPYDLVISDVFLADEDTGIDLWRRYGEVSDHFVFVSSMSLGTFDALIHTDTGIVPGLPFYLQKPLSTRLCRDVLKSIL